jgi:hypothetical protein
MPLSALRMDWRYLEATRVRYEVWTLGAFGSRSVFWRRIGDLESYWSRGCRTTSASDPFQSAKSIPSVLRPGTLDELEADSPWNPTNPINGFAFHPTPSSRRCPPPHRLLSQHHHARPSIHPSYFLMTDPMANASDPVACSYETLPVRSRMELMCHVDRGSSSRSNQDIKSW